MGHVIFTSTYSFGHYMQIMQSCIGWSDWSTL